MSHAIAFNAIAVGYGATIDVIVSNGTLRSDDRLVICGMNGPIVTVIKALLLPNEGQEMRVNGVYKTVASVSVSEDRRHQRLEFRRRWLANVYCAAQTETEEQRQIAQGMHSHPHKPSNRPRLCLAEINDILAHSHLNGQRRDIAEERIFVSIWFRKVAKMLTRVIMKRRRVKSEEWEHVDDEEDEGLYI